MFICKVKPKYQRFEMQLRESTSSKRLRIEGPAHVVMKKELTIRQLRKQLREAKVDYAPFQDDKARLLERLQQVRQFQLLGKKLPIDTVLLNLAEFLSWRCLAQLSHTCFDLCAVLTLRTDTQASRVILKRVVADFTGHGRSHFVRHPRQWDWLMQQLGQVKMFRMTDRPPVGDCAHVAPCSPLLLDIELHTLELDQAAVIFQRCPALRRLTVTHLERTGEEPDNFQLPAGPDSMRSLCIRRDHNNTLALFVVACPLLEELTLPYLQNSDAPTLALCNNITRLQVVLNNHFDWNRLMSELPLVAKSKLTYLCVTGCNGYVPAAQDVLLPALCNLHIDDDQVLRRLVAPRLQLLSMTCATAFGTDQAGVLADFCQTCPLLHSIRLKSGYTTTTMLPFVQLMTRRRFVKVGSRELSWPCESLRLLVLQSFTSSSSLHHHHHQQLQELSDAASALTHARPNLTVCIERDRLAVDKQRAPFANEL